MGSGGTSEAFRFLLFDGEGPALANDLGFLS